MTRGDFIAAAIKALGIPVSKTAYDGERVAPALSAYIETAKEKGALDVFTRINAAAAITRGEALQVLLKLAGIATAAGAKTDFSDVKDGTPEAYAVTVAIKSGWLDPIRASSFGIKSPVTRIESAQLLATVARQKKDVKDMIKINPPNVQVQTRPTTSSDLPKKDILEQVWNILNSEYYYRDKLSGDEAGYKAAEALVQSVGDPYTVFMRPSQARNFNATIFNGQITGIGAQVEQKKNAAGEMVLTIVSPLPGSPAEKAGLQPDDEILSADSVSLAGMSFDDAVDKVRGPKGSTVHLHIRRSGSELDVAVMRDAISIPEISVTRQGNVVIVKLIQFGKATNDNFRKTMLEVQKANPTGIVLDLRNNPGGLLTASERVMSAFVPKNTVFTIVRSFDGSEEKDATLDDPIINSSIPVAVLVNKGSASASEIVAGAMQDLKRATIVGEKTFGKGSVQTVSSFADGSSLKVTRAKWFTPNGRGIDKGGVEGSGGIIPDTLVTDSQADKDASLRRALDLLR
ncbi:MAG: carboxy-terminal processing protease [Candidatus Peribacteria bacterium]|nr:carboxy-terminal processing protease [Candidatus Peribacteria bacterium]